MTKQTKQSWEDDIRGVQQKSFTTASGKEIVCDVESLIIFIQTLLDERTQKIIEDLEYYWNEKWIKTESKEIQSQYKGYKIAINVIKQKYENKN